MIVHYPFFALALLLLLFPRQWLGVRKRRGRRRRSDRAGGRDEPGLGEGADDGHIRLLDEWRDWRNFVDLARAGAAAWLLSRLVFSLDPALGKEAARLAELQILGLQAGALLAGAVVQTLRPGRVLALVAPVAFIVGLTFGALDAKAAGFALVLLVALNLVVPRPVGFFFGYAAVIGVFGFAFMGLSKLLLVMGVVVLVPAIISLLTKTRLRPLTTRGRQVI